MLQVVKDDGQVVSDKFKILDETKSFYKNLCKKKEIIKSDVFMTQF